MSNDQAGGNGSRPVLEVSGLSKTFPVRVAGFRREYLSAVHDVSFQIGPGKTLAVVGESGSGKTTLARLVLRLIDSNAGSIKLGGVEITGLAGKELEKIRNRMQMVFQDPYDSLSPWQTIGRTIREPLQIHQGLDRKNIAENTVSILERVGLTAEHARRYPHEISGGQAQRVGIARAIVTHPSLVILDEPTSSLDMSVQAQILLLLQSVQAELGLAYLFISHDLTVVRYIAHEVAVMYLGQIVEYGPTEKIFADPRHPYTEALLAAAPRPDPTREVSRLGLSGDPPSALQERTGCSLYGRCPIAVNSCQTMLQDLLPAGEGHQVACWRRADNALEPQGGKNETSSN